ncbi:hypothetical protein BDN72DRAFT_957668 [Pluteus cervinus]|uniref:Uncharacterized protein n=1 Tax=Pluteus cervinus TaxID=181527 RepID=A0ACD3B219_9AGAR|nr:hypothetical protein BDN72DRAFT_957668 [Pluteus cervinus]
MDNSGPMKFHNNKYTHNLNGTANAAHGETANNTSNPSTGATMNSNYNYSPYTGGGPVNLGAANGNHNPNFGPAPRAYQGTPVAGPWPYGPNPPFYPPPGCVYPPGPGDPAAGPGQQQFPPGEPRMPWFPPHTYVQGRGQDPWPSPPPEAQPIPSRVPQAVPLPANAATGEGMTQV